MIHATFTLHKKLVPIMVVMALGLLGVAGCGGGSDDEDPPVTEVTAEVAGYYTGTASVKEADNSTDLAIDDLTVFVHGSRIMAMGRLSDPVNFVLYDIEISSIEGNSFRAVATIYKAAVNIGTTQVTGEIDSGTGMSGTFAGSGIANGTFQVVLDADINAQIADVGDIVGFTYGGDLNTGDSTLRFDIFAGGEVVSIKSSVNAIKMSGCDLITGSTITAIADENLYTINFVLSGCDESVVDGTYTGFASTIDLAPTVLDVIMPAAFSNGSYAGVVEFER